LPASREYRNFWNTHSACKDAVDAASCDAKAAGYNCSWWGEPAYCGSSVDFNCDGGPQTTSCKVFQALVETETTCAKATTKAACGANEACEWSASRSWCYYSSYGETQALKKLGSKSAEAMYAQRKTCNKLATRQACLVEPLPAAGTAAGRASASTPSPSPSPARNGALPVPLAATCATALMVAAAMALLGI
jgi:hypothetical protein